MYEALRFIHTTLGNLSYSDCLVLDALEYYIIFILVWILCAVNNSKRSSTLISVHHCPCWADFGNVHNIIIIWQTLQFLKEDYMSFHYKFPFLSNSFEHPCNQQGLKFNKATASIVLACFLPCCPNTLLCPPVHALLVCTSKAKSSKPKHAKKTHYSKIWILRRFILSTSIQEGFFFQFGVM
jgi:hypothetical protein